MSAMIATEQGFVEVPGGSLYYEVAGSGHPLVLVHADVADRRMWDEQLAVFARHYRVVRYDKRGFGRSTSQDGTYSPRADLVALLAHLGIAKTAVLGLSNGGALVLDFTLEHPELVDALIVVAGGVGGFEWEPTPAEMALFSEYETLEEHKDYPGLIEIGLRTWADGPGQPEGRADAPVRERLREMMTEMYRDHHEELRSARLEPPAAGRLGEIHVPTLVIVGDLDVSDTIGAMDYLARHVAGARKVVFPGTAHMVNMEQPERFNATVLRFLEPV